MSLHHPQARSPSSFAFPSPSLSTSARSPARDSAHTKGAPSLGAAFQYPVRGDSLQQHGAQHAAQASTSSSSTTSSSDFRSPSTARSAVSSTYTSFTSDSHDHDDACDDGYSDAGSVLDSLYRDFSSARLDDSPPRFHQHTASTDSTMQLRERTRYRSSASFVPGAAPAPSSSAQPPHHHLEGSFGHLSLASTAAAAAAAVTPHSHMALLAALAAASSTLDRCFCGAEPEDDSIYCSRACAQADALNALCGTSSSAEDAASSSDAASLRSGSSGGSSGAGGIDSHYRRVRREEERRAKERERAQRKEDKARKARALEERELAQAQDRRSTSGSLRRSEGDVGSSRASAQDSVAPPPRTSSRRTPSLSSSVSSLASSAAPSPISPAFPQHAAFPPHHASASTSSSPFIIEPPTPSTHSFHDAPLGPVAEEELLARPCTPNPRAHHHSSLGARSPASPAHLDASEIYSSYLLATPQAGDKLRTPTQLPHAYYSGSGSGSGSGCNSTPRAAFPHTPGGPDDVDDDSPTQRGVGAAGTAGVGLRMLELCDSDDEDDNVGPLRGGHRRAAPLGGGHTKGKLSFDDVVGILSG